MEIYVLLSHAALVICRFHYFRSVFTDGIFGFGFICLRSKHAYDILLSTVVRPRESPAPEAALTRPSRRDTLKYISYASRYSHCERYANRTTGLCTNAKCRFSQSKKTESSRFERRQPTLTNIRRQISCRLVDHRYRTQTSGSCRRQCIGS